jgi:hypothetical protein
VTLGSQQDEVHHPAGSPLLGAVREEEVGPAGRAEPRILDPVWADPGLLQDGAVHPGQIQPAMAESSRRRVRFPVGERRGHRPHHRRVHLETASADPGPEGRPAIGRIRPIGRLHGEDGPGRDPLRRPPPAGVNGRHRPSDRIMNQDRQAISRRDHQSHIRQLRDKRVELGRLLHQAARKPGAPHQACIHPQDLVPMHLFGADDPGRIDAEGDEEAPPVLLHEGEVVPHALPQIERGERGPADSALPAAERVNDLARLGEQPGPDERRRPQELL